MDQASSTIDTSVSVGEIRKGAAWIEIDGGHFYLATLGK